MPENRVLACAGLSSMTCIALQTIPGWSTSFYSINSPRPGMEKKAIDAVNDFTRAKMREDGFYRRILPLLQIRSDVLDCKAHNLRRSLRCVGPIREQRVCGNAVIAHMRVLGAIQQPLDLVSVR